MHRLTGLVAALLLACSPTWAATLNATPANLYQQIQAARPETQDVVLVGPGVYGNAGLWNLSKAAPGVVVEVPASVGSAADFTSLNVSGSNNVTFRGFHIQAAPGTQYAVAVGGGTGIVLDRFTVNQRDNTSLAGVGIFVRGASNITVSNSTLHHFWGGLSAYEADAVRFIGNTIYQIESDAIVLAGTGNSLVQGNRAHSILFTLDWSHPDFIQLFATAAKPSPANNRIIGNRYERGAGKVAQGVFVEDNVDLLIQDNALFGAMTNGIGLARAHRTTIRHNFVQGWPDMGARIIVRGAAADVQVVDNTAQFIADYQGEGPNPNLALTGNTIIPGASSSTDRALLDAWLAGTGTPAPTPVPTPTPAPTPTPVPTPPADNIVTLNLGPPTVNCRIDVERQNPVTKKWSAFQPRIQTRCKAP